MAERYIIAESSGYLMALRGGELMGGRWVTEYMVLDTAYCHRVVWTSLRNSAGVALGSRSSKRQLTNREAATEVCRRFNDHGSRLPRYHFPSKRPT